MMKIFLLINIIIYNGKKFFFTHNYSATAAAVVVL